MEGSEFGSATNDDGANDREIEWKLHDFCLSPAFLSATLRFVPPFPRETSVLSLQQFRLLLAHFSPDVMSDVTGRCLVEHTYPLQ